MMRKVKNISQYARCVVDAGTKDKQMVKQNTTHEKLNLDKFGFRLNVF